MGTCLYVHLHVWCLPPARCPASPATTTRFWPRPSFPCLQNGGTMDQGKVLVQDHVPKVKVSGSCV